MESAEYNIKTVRVHLFETLEKLKSGAITDTNAKAVASVAQTILNSAKLEIEYKKMNDRFEEKIEMLEIGI